MPSAPLIGVTGQVSAVDKQFTGEENLRLIADLRHLGRDEGRRRVAELLERFDLVDAAGKPASTYSGGMRRRLDLAMTLIGDPRIIFLDEPTTGLDPRSRRVMWQTIRELVAGGVTILLTTQYLEEADRLADRIAILDQRPDRRRGHARGAQATRPGRPHPARRSPDATELERAAGVLDVADRDDEALSLLVPGTGGVGSLRTLLDQARRRLARRERAVRPDPRPRRCLPDAHGRPGRQQRWHHDDRAPDGRRLGDHAPPQPPPDAALSLADPLHRGLPVVFLLLFVYVFGGAIGAGLGDVTAGREAYLAYVIPGILLMTVAGGAQGTAISVAMDMTEGIIARFRTMAIARGAVLTGHVVGSVIQTMLAVVIVMAVALLIGFRPTTGPLEWVAAAGLLALTAVAISWLSVALGMVPKDVETASNLPMFLVILPFLSSGFVPTETMPGPLAWFAEHQPFTPIIETIRGLLLGTPIGSDGIVAVAWCVGISILGYLWSRRLYDRNPA